MGAQPRELAMWALILGCHCAGGWLFDPLGLSGDAQRYEDARVQELKNGRLAMVAWLGFAAQAAATQEGPIANLLSVVSHLPA